MKQIRICQLFTIVKLMNRYTMQTETQSDIENAALNIIFLLQS